MKAWKKCTALVLCVACVCALICVPPAGAAAAVSTFPDITDPQVGRAVEALRTMGVIDGSGGRFLPDDSLTRAQFCKMAILAMGKGSEADAQASRTIFTDVPGSHWARGYVNLAANTTVGGEEEEGGTRLMMGLGNGSFAPDRPITYGEAVTAILRILGYVKEANSNWPHGAVSSAASLGLTQGFTPPAAGDAINRAQAALLFCNMLTTPMEGGSKDSTYVEDYLKCALEKGALLLLTDTTTQSGQTGAVKVFATKGTHNDTAVVSAVNTPADFLVGSKGTAVFDKSGKFLTFLPDAASSSKTITVASASGGVLTATDGTKYTPSPSTKVWEGGKDSDYSSKHNSIQAGTSITVCFTEAGTIDYLFVHGTNMTLSGGVMVAREKPSGNPFAQLTAGTVDYKIVKNGVEVTTSALKQYDVAAFDPTNKTLYVTDFRLTGVYESATPNTTMPTKITVLGKELEVLDSAVDDLKNLKLNSTVTLLLSPDGKVAGAVSSSTLRSNTVGYVEGSTIHLLNAPRTGEDGPNLSELTLPDGVDKARYADCLVTVTGYRSGNTNTVGLSRISERTSSISLDVTRRTLGDTALAENVAIFDRIYNSGIQPISLSDVSMTTVPASKIVYQRTNSDGKIDLLVLSDVTGDLYTYGICKTRLVDENGNPYDPSADDPEQGDEDDKKPQVTYINRITTVINSKGENGGNSSLPIVGGTSYKDGQFIGLAASVQTLNESSNHRHAASVALKSVEKVTPANFNMDTMLFYSGSIELPVWDGVQCYNAQTKTWFGANDKDATGLDNLRACLAYSSKLTVWYDRDPAQGGKVRIVVAN